VRTAVWSKLSNVVGWPSRSSAGSVTPARLANVAMKSRQPTISELRRPGSIVPGHQAMAGTRLPASKSVPLVPRNGVYPQSGYTSCHAPLSVVQMTSVSCSMPSSRTLSMTTPTW